MEGRAAGWGAVARAEKGEGPEEGPPGTQDQDEGLRKGDAEVGPREGEEKREFKLLTLLVFLK